MAVRHESNMQVVGRVARKLVWAAREMKCRSRTIAACWGVGTGQLHRYVAITVCEVLE